MLPANCACDRSISAWAGEIAGAEGLHECMEAVIRVSTSAMPSKRRRGADRGRASRAESANAPARPAETIAGG
jgi:hypothetical protein